MHVLVFGSIHQGAIVVHSFETQPCMLSLHFVAMLTKGTLSPSFAFAAVEAELLGHLKADPAAAPSDQGHPA